MQRQQNLINDLIRAADGLQNLNTNANTQQLQNTQQHEYLRQAFPTTRHATNLGAPSNKTNANHNNYKIHNNMNTSDKHFQQILLQQIA